MYVFRIACILVVICHAARFGLERHWGRALQRWEGTEEDARRGREMERESEGGHVDHRERETDRQKDR